MKIIELNEAFEVRINPESKILKSKETGEEVTVYAVAKTFQNNNGKLEQISTTWMFHTENELEENRDGKIQQKG